jgi:hypothetical protein
VPQAPQLRGSLATSAHDPFMHRTVDAAHMHTPDVQVPPGPQPRPHMPQFAVSVARFAQPDAHATWAAAHWHAPAVHVAPLGHARPQAPQWALSVCRFAHTPAQMTCGAVQVPPHVPLTQS